MTTFTKSALVAAVAGSAMTMSAGAASAATYSIDPTHTFVTFEIDHFATSTNRGRFDKKQGTVTFDRAAKTGKVEITIDTTSINSGTAAFDKHLKSDEILKTTAYPTAKFVADKFSFSGDAVTEVVGQLTLLGKTQPVTLKASKFNCYMNPMFKREVCGGDFEATLTRSQFGVNYGLDWGFSDTMKLVIQVEAIKQ